MTDTAPDTVLHRKAQAQRRVLGGGAWSIPRALGRALSIAADALWGLTLVPRPLADDTLPVDRALSRLGHDPLLVVLDHDTAPCGLVGFDRDIVAGLIDVQTLGRVTHLPAEMRAYTPTDAAMTAPLIDAALPRFASMLSGQTDLDHLRDYRFGALVEDAPSAGLALEAESYHLVEFEVGLAQDTRTGRVMFLFPEPAPQVEPGHPAAPGKHETVLKLAPVRMQAVLTRVHLPLDKARALRPGDVLTLSPQATASAALVLSGGHVVARGRLGQMNGFRAIRIGADPQALVKPEPVPTLPSEPAETGITKVPLPAVSSAFDLPSDLTYALDGGATDLPRVPEPGSG